MKCLIPRTAGVILIATACLCSCAQSDNANNQTSSAATPNPTPPPAVPDPEKLAGLVTRFYHDLNVGTKTSIGDIGLMLSSHFMSAQGKNWSRDYGYIRNARVSIDSTAGRNVTYTVDYDYVADNGFKVSWERVGTWAFIHGSGEWYLDSDKWKSVHLTAVTMKDGTRYAVQDVANGNGSHFVEVNGVPELFLATNNGWSFAPLRTPEPVAADPPPPAAAPDPYSPPLVTTPITRVPNADCEEVDVTDVYQDGAVLHLDTGRYLRVADYDTATSSVWVAPFDGLICDNGAKFTNKDDNETVDLQP